MDSKQILHYLAEVRMRLLKIGIAFLTLFALCFHYSNPLLITITKPLSQLLNDNNQLIATNITSPLLTPLQLSLHLSLLLVMPYCLLQLWGFFAPAMYHHEKKILRYSLIMSFILFITGVAFCYQVILPLMFAILTKALPSQITLLPDIAHTITFILNFCLLFGLCFQLPLLLATLTRLNLVSQTQLKTIRPYAIVACFTLGMLLTPPDVVSQLMLALPLVLLYEIGIVCSKAPSPKLEEVQR